MKHFFLLILLFTGIGLSSAIAQNATYDNNSDVLISEYEVNLYPNPVTDGILKVNTSHTIKMVEIINVIGQTIQKNMSEENTTEMTIQLADMQKGMYLVRVTFENKKSIIKKILVKN